MVFEKLVERKETISHGAHGAQWLKLLGGSLMANEQPNETAGAHGKLRRLWQMGDLFHNCERYPRKAAAPRVDRLAGRTSTRSVTTSC